MARAEDQVRELLKLSPEERAHAASILLESLEPAEGDAGAEQAQADEIARRLATLKGGPPCWSTAPRCAAAWAARVREIRGV